MTTLTGTDLNLLTALRVLLEQRNLTRAGLQLGVGQPTMSLALARLRQHYGDELLLRVGREYELTPLARTLLPEVQKAVPLIERAFRLDEVATPAWSNRTFDIALSDYAGALLERCIRQVLGDESDTISLRLHPVPENMHVEEFGLLEFDLMVAPLGFGFVGESVELFRDRFVCIIDPDNPALTDGALTLDAFLSLDHAHAARGVGHLTPYERHMAERGVKTEVRITATGWLPLAFVVAGTQLVGIMPERLAMKLSPITGIVAVDPPFGDVPLVEALWWHRTRDADPTSRWLRQIVRQAACNL